MARVEVRLFGNHWRYYAHLPHRVYDSTKTAILSFFQRGMQGWADADTWNLDTYLARVIGESIAYTERHEHGHPYSFEERYGERAHEEWIAYLRATSQAFLAYAAFMHSEEAMADVGNVKYTAHIEHMKHLFDYYSFISN